MAVAEAPPRTATFFDVLAAALRRAGAYNKNDQAAPVAVLWPDKERQWEPLLPRLRQRLPILTFGPYAPDSRSGPAYWLRAALARALPEIDLPPDETPIVYLPGVSRQELRAVEECPPDLQPLAELQYRGVLWTHKNGRDWTASAFLQAADGGLGIEVAGDNATREALARALGRVADEPVARLRKAAPLRAEMFDGLLNPDEARTLLLWLNDPDGQRASRSAEEWASFRELCRRAYGFDPEQDGELSGAALLGGREGAWETVWQRFAESPGSYAALPDLLRRARPQAALPMFDHGESWPQENEAAEAALRAGLRGLENALPAKARAAVNRFEAEHGPRRGWVWGTLGRAPLAFALRHLAALGQRTEQALGGPSAEAVAMAYAEWGWKTDLEVLYALAEVEQAEDVAAVKAAVGALYRSWLENGARAFQKVASAGDPSRSYPVQPFEAPPAGTCVLFTDGLRYDAGTRLVASLERAKLSCELSWRLAALPSITPTAKPAVSPVAARFGGGAGLEPTASEGGAKVTVEVLRRTLGEAGFQVLRGDEVGDPAGRAWTELGDVDDYGHEHGWKLAHHLAGEIRLLAGRVAALLEAGWKRVVVVTDHGFLLLPGGLPKVELPEHLAVVRKGRCARLKELSSIDQLSMPWHWDPHVRIALAPGIACFETGREYEHGGLSPQECVVPVITVTSQAETDRAHVTIDSVGWRGLRCVVKVGSAREGLSVDLRAKPNDPESSLAAPKLLDDQGEASLPVADDDREGDAAVVVVLDGDGKLLAQAPTVVGGAD